MNVKSDHHETPGLRLHVDRTAIDEAVRERAPDCRPAGDAVAMESSPARTKARPKAIVVAIVVLLWLVSGMAPGHASDLRNDIIGSNQYYQVKEKETLLDIARLHDLGFIELVAANPGVDPWLPGLGRTVLLPTQHLLPGAPRRGIVINLPELRLYYFGDGSRPAATYPIGVGRLGRETPLGSTSVVAKRKDPVWIPPQSIRAERPELPAAIPPGPDNPLGLYALNLGWPSYVIHGTNKPYGIGRRVSSGCIRMYPEDIERLFETVAMGTPVTVVDQPVKLGWSEGELYLEVHPTVEEGDELEARGWFIPIPVQRLKERVIEAAGRSASRIYWPSVHRAARAKRGIPVQITH